MSLILGKKEEKHNLTTILKEVLAAVTEPALFFFARDIEDNLISEQFTFADMYGVKEGSYFFHSHLLNGSTK